MSRNCCERFRRGTRTPPTTRAWKKCRVLGMWGPRRTIPCFWLWQRTYVENGEQGEAGETAQWKRERPTEAAFIIPSSPFFSPPASLGCLEPRIAGQIYRLMKNERVGRNAQRISVKQTVGRGGVGAAMLVRKGRPAG